MALIQYFADDIDGTQDDTVKPRIIQLPDGVLKLDLSDANFTKLSDALVKAAQRVVKAETFTKFYVEGADGPVSENAIIRKWASEQRNADGTPMYEVSVKGRVAADIVTAYRKSLADSAGKAPEAGNPNDNADKASEAVNELVNA